MASVGILRQALASVHSTEDATTVDLCIELIDLLGAGNNLFIYEQLKEALQSQSLGFNYCKMIEQKLIHATSELVKEGMDGSMH